MEKEKSDYLHLREENLSERPEFYVQEYFASVDSGLQTDYELRFGEKLDIFVSGLQFSTTKANGLEALNYDSYDKFITSLFNSTELLE